MPGIVHIPDDLASRITAAGVNAESVALQALRQAAEELERARRVTGRRTPAEAAARMRQSRSGNTLPDGISIRDLMTYGRA